MIRMNRGTHPIQTQHHLGDSETTRDRTIVVVHHLRHATLTKAEEKPTNAVGARSQLDPNGTMMEVQDG